MAQLRVTNRKREDYFTDRMFRRQFKPALLSAAGLAVGDMADALVLGQKMEVTGLAAVSMALPVFMVINVLMHGLGIGGSIRFSREQAEGKPEAARKGFLGIMAIAMVISTGLAMIGNLFLTQLLAVLGTTASDGELFYASRTYIQITVSGMPLFFLSYITNYYLRNDDKEKLAGLGFTTGNLCDIGLNILFVLGFDWGVAGAAFATLAGQAVSFGIYIYGIARDPGNLWPVPLTPSIEGWLSSFAVGFSSSSQYLFSMLFYLIMNHMLMRLGGSTGVAVFEMVQTASYLILYLYDAAARALQPLVSTYLGERNRHGMKRALLQGILWGLTAGMLSTVLIAAFPKLICRIFGLTATPAVELGCRALRIYCAGSAMAGINIIVESYFQSAGKSHSALRISWLRGAGILIPAALLFSRAGLRNLWWLYPVTELLSLILLGIRNRADQEKRDMEDQDAVYTKILDADVRELTSLSEDVDHFCTRWNAEESQKYFVTMAAEELCSIIIDRGFENSDGYIQLTLVAEDKGVFALHVRDSAAFFNPFTQETETVDKEEGVDMGAMGMLLIRNVAKEIYYRQYQGFNTLVVKI